MSPLFAAMPPADLPTNAYLPPTGVHATAMLATSTSDTQHTVRPGDTVYDIAAAHRVSVEAIVRANNLTDGGRWILPGSTLTIPGTDDGAGSSDRTGARSSSASPSASSGSSTSSSAGGTVTVHAGDTLSHLALRHGVNVGALVSANDITNSRLIYPGQVLVIPGKAGSSSSTSSTASSTATSTRDGSASSARSSSSSNSSSGSITVRAGDTLYDLAARHGVTVSDLAKANDLSNTRLIYPGQRLRLPGESPGTDTRSSARSETAASRSEPSRASTPAAQPTAPEPTAPTHLSRPYDQHTIGDLKVGEDVPNTFLHYTYSSAVARAAAANREYLASIKVPSREAMRTMIADTATKHGVDPDLMVALSYQESGWNHAAVSTANAIGAMQVIPSSGQWASQLVGRDLNLLDPQDNVTAGVVIMAALQSSADQPDHAIGGYYQGLASVRQYGLFPDTRSYIRNIKHLMATL